MPKLDTTLHTGMLKRAQRDGQPDRDGLYGIQWGNPETHAALRTVRDHWLVPYVNPKKTAVEIGPGGGRWTRYMVGFKKLWAVDFHQELLDELGRNFSGPNISRLKNNGTDFPGIADKSVDFVFSFGVFVHLAIEVQTGYLQSLRRIIKPSTQIVIQYADFDKKPARDNDTFTENNPRMMREMVEGAGYKIVEEDNVLLWHSAIMRFQQA